MLYQAVNGVLLSRNANGKIAVYADHPFSQLLGLIIPAAGQFVVMRDGEELAAASEESAVALFAGASWTARHPWGAPVVSLPAIAA